MSASAGKADLKNAGNTKFLLPLVDLNAGLTLLLQPGNNPHQAMRITKFSKIQGATDGSVFDAINGLIRLKFRYKSTENRPVRQNSRGKLERTMHAFRTTNAEAVDGGGRALSETGRRA